MLHLSLPVSPQMVCHFDLLLNISKFLIFVSLYPILPNSAFTNCNLQCSYCQNWQISRNNPDRKETEMSLEEVIREIAAILDTGINMVGFVSPSHVIPQVKIIIDALESSGYHPVKVYNSNGYDKVGTLRSLEGIIDVYLPDFKYMEPLIAHEYSGARDYPEVASLALKEMYRQKGAALHLAGDGTAESGIIVRHLVLPGQVENSRKVLRFIAEELSPRLHVSLMSQYYPTPGVCNHPHLGRSLRRYEYDQVVDEMNRLGLINGWVQELESGSNYRPDFKKDHPFEY